MKTPIRFLAGAALAGLVLLTAAPAAQATLQLTITDANNSSGNFSRGYTSGSTQTVTATLGNFTYSSTDFGSNLATDSLFTGATSIKNNSGSTDTATITISDNGFTTASSPRILFSQTSAGSTGGGGNSFTFNSYGGVSLGQHGTSAPTITISSTQLSGSSSVAFTPGSTFSLTETVTITLAAGSTATLLEGSTYLSPEPASALLVLAGLPTMLMAFRRGKPRLQP